VEKAEVEVDREQVMNEMREGKKEQEDLLVLLADQDTKLKTYRRRLKELGEKVCHSWPRSQSNSVKTVYNAE